MQNPPDLCGRYGIEPRWHCIATNWGQDQLALRCIIADGWQAYAPLHLRRRDRIIEALFPGYLFASFPPDADWPRICRQRGVYRILGRPGRPEPLPVGAIEDLIARTSFRGVVDDPGENATVVRLHPGQRAQVIDGPLTGFEGICTASRGQRISLLLSLFGRQQQVEFRPQAVAPL